MNFLACNGSWTVGPAGEISCSGDLVTYTAEELQEAVNPGMTLEEAVELKDGALVLFSVVFCFLVLKKAL